MVVAEHAKKAKIELSILSPNANESEFISLGKCSNDSFHVGRNVVRDIIENLSNGYLILGVSPKTVNHCVVI